MTISDTSDDDDDEPPMLVNLTEEVHVPVGDNNTTETETIPTVSSTPAVIDFLSDLPPCPVTILSGFLGSGKTTLIQYILKSPDHKKRIAVIENEFGGDGLAIESMIARDGVDNSSLADFIELPNGCVCCTVKDSLVATLEGLVTRRSDLDYILIEASGMANPGPIASVFWLDEELGWRLRLDGVVTLVDAYHLRQQLTETLEASQQIAYADRILLNKTDLVDESTAAEIRALLKSMNPTAEIQTTTYSRVPDLDWILDAQCYNNDPQSKMNQFSKTVQQLAAAAELQEHDETDDHHHDHEHHHNHDDHATATDDCGQCRREQHPQQHSHTSAVTTLAFSEKGTMDLEKINAWLASTLWPNQDEKDEVLRSRLEQQLSKDEEEDKNATTAATAAALTPSNGTLASEADAGQQQQQIFRIKGILSVKCNENKVGDEEWAFCDPQTGIHSRRFILQAVYDLWDCLASHEAFDSDDQRECKLVVIGRHLDRESLHKGFQSCLI